MITQRVAHDGQIATHPGGIKGWLTLDRVYIAAVLAVVAAGALNIIVRPHDFWWHLANGRTIIETGVLPSVDRFTYTQAGEPFFNQMWLVQVIMYTMHRLGGVALVLTAHAIVITAAFALLLRLCIRLTGRVRLSALVLLFVVVPLSFVNWGVRPQPYAFPIFVAFLSIVVFGRSQDSSHRTVPSWWLLPLLMAVWVNIHGSYVLGLVVVTTVACTEALLRAFGHTDISDRQMRRLAVVAVATWAATLLNPRGAAVLSYATDLMRNESVATVTEWQPMSPTDMVGFLYFLAASALTLLMIYGRRRPVPRETIVVIAFMLLGFSAVRHTAWFAFAAGPLVCLQVGSMLKAPVREDAEAPLLNGLLLGTLAVVLALSLPWSRQTLDLPIGSRLTGETPVVATRKLVELPQRPDRIFHDIGYGSYLAWALPDQGTFIDPRFELFPTEQVEDYDALSEGRDVDALVEKYDFDGFLVSHKYQPELIRVLERSDDWRLVHEDEQASLFVASS